MVRDTPVLFFETMNKRKPHSFSAADVAQASQLGSAMLALNNAHAQELSWLESGKLQHIAAHAFLARRIGEVDAFILALDQDAPYDSPNFLWFRDRYPRFVYVDRRLIGARTRLRAAAL